MNPKETTERLDGIRNKCTNGYDVQAINNAIHAIRIVTLIENTFEHNKGEGLIDFADWKEIKEYTHNHEIEENDEV